MEVVLSDKYIEEIVQARVDKRTKELKDSVKYYKEQNKDLQKKLDKRIYVRVNHYGRQYYTFDKVTEDLKNKHEFMMRYYNVIQEFNNKTFPQKLGFILRGEKLNDK